MSDSTITTVTSSTTTYVSGTSGYDFSALIEAEYQSELSGAYDLEDEVEEDELVYAAYEEMDGYLDDILSAAEELTTNGDFGETSVWDEKAAYLTSDGSDADSLVGVAVDETADAGTYELEIQQVATAHKVASGTIADSSADLGYDGEFTISSASGTDATIIVESDTSLTELAYLINLESEDTGVSATILQVDENDYRLILTADDTNQEISIASTSGDDVMNLIGVTDGAGGFSNEMQEAQEAIVVIDGITVYRDENDIDDLLDGVTISLYGEEAGTTITLEIEEDMTAIYEAVQAFVDAYNVYREFALTHQATDSDGTAAEDAYLFGDSVLRNVNAQLYDYMSKTVTVDDVDYALGNFGITYDDDNYLEIDETDLEDAIVNNLDAIKAFFEFDATVSSDDLAVTGHAGAYGSMDLTLNITVDADGDITAVDIDGDDSAVTWSGSIIYGAEGTAYEGLEFTYIGDTSQSIDVAIAQGIADQMSYLLDLWTDDETGTLTEILSDMAEDLEDKYDEIDDIYDDAEDRYEELVAKYAAIEAEIEANELITAQIEALVDASNS